MIIKLLILSLDNIYTLMLCKCFANAMQEKIKLKIKWMCGLLMLSNCTMYCDASHTSQAHSIMFGYLYYNSSLNRYKCTNYLL